MSPEPMDEKRLAEIEARVEAATPGPWLGVTNCRGCDELHLDGLGDGPRACDGRKASAAPKDPDRTFLTHARQDVPDLLAEVRRLRAELGSARALASMTDAEKAQAELALRGWPRR